MRGWLPSVPIGVVAGFAGLFVREMGMVIAGAVIILLGGTYVLQRRPQAFAWLLIGISLPWLILPGPIAVAGLVDRQRAATAPETYVGVLAALFVAGFGVALLIITRPRGGRNRTQA